MAKTKDTNKKDPKAKGFQLSYRYRIHPTAEQAAFFEQNFECCRFVYNHYLRARIDAYERTQETLSRPKIVEGTEDNEKPEWVRDAQGKVIYEDVPNANYDPEAKPMSLYDTTYDIKDFKKQHSNNEGEHFLLEADASSLIYSLRNLDAAYQNFFRGRKTGQKVGFPQFKRKGSVKKYKTQFNNLAHIKFPKDGTKYGWIKVPKAGWVKTIIHRYPEGLPITISIEHTAADRWYATLNVKEVDIKPLSPKSDTIGLTTGISEWLVTSDGEVFDNPRRRDAMQKRLTRAQRILSRRQGAKKGQTPSKRYKKQQLRVALLNAKLAAQRSDDTHKLTHTLVAEHGTIISRQMAVQDMKAKGEDKALQGKARHQVNRKLDDANLFEINRQLAYKSLWAGRTYIEVPSTQPTAQTCSQCGYKYTVLAKDLRPKWTCPECGAKHHRKANGALNVLDAGLEMIRG